MLELLLGALIAAGLIWLVQRAPMPRTLSALIVAVYVCWAALLLTVNPVATIQWFP